MKHRQDGGPGRPKASGRRPTGKPAARPRGATQKGQGRSRAAPGTPAKAHDADASPAVGDNLRRLRSQRGLSLDALARASGVSRAMLSQVELGRSAPTINVLWKIARSLNVPFSALIVEPAARRAHVLNAASAKILASRDGTFSSRALFPFDEPRRVEFYELRLARGGAERAEAHAPGTIENLVVASGALEMRVGEERHELAEGDAIQFRADVAHEYRNRGGKEAVLYLVMTYADDLS